MRFDNRRPVHPTGSTNRHAGIIHALQRSRQRRVPFLIPYDEAQLSANVFPELPRMTKRTVGTGGRHDEAVVADGRRTLVERVRQVSADSAAQCGGHAGFRVDKYLDNLTVPFSTDNQVHDMSGVPRGTAFGNSAYV